MLDWMNHKLELRLPEEIPNNLRYAFTLMAESEEELKSFLVKVKRGEGKGGLKLNIQEAKIVASGCTAFWQINGEKLETVTDFIFLGSKITADCDCSHEIKILAPWKKSYDKSRQCIKKQRHHFDKKGSYNQGYGFSSSHVWMWVLDRKEDWAPNNKCFPAVVLEKTLESPLDSKEIKTVNPKENQPWVFIGRNDAEAEVLGYLMQRADSLEKTLMLRKIEGKKRRDWQKMR